MASLPPSEEQSVVESSASSPPPLLVSMVAEVKVWKVTRLVELKVSHLDPEITQLVIKVWRLSMASSNMKATNFKQQRLRYEALIMRDHIFRGHIWRGLQLCFRLISLVQCSIISFQAFSYHKIFLFSNQIFQIQFSIDTNPHSCRVPLLQKTKTTKPYVH